VIAVAIRILDVVRQAIAKVDAVAAQDDGLLRTARPLLEVDLKELRELLLFREPIVTKRRILFFLGPAARCLEAVALGRLVERYAGLAADLPQQVPHAAKQATVLVDTGRPTDRAQDVADSRAELEKYRERGPFGAFAAAWLP